LTAGVVIVLVLAFVGAAFVAAPLLREAGPEAALTSPALANARDLQSRRDMLLASLRDLEDDHATDKISLADYEELHGRLSAQAIEVLDGLDDLEHDRERSLEAERRFGSAPRQRSRPSS